LRNGESESTLAHSTVAAAGGEFSVSEWGPHRPPMAAARARNIKKNKDLLQAFAGARRRCEPRESVGISAALASTAQRQRKQVMSLLIVYVGLMITGDFVAYFIGLGIEKVAPAASLPAFLAMYFLFLWIAWLIAVRITAPRAKAQ
jgi:hypothetical protein